MKKFQDWYEGMTVGQRRFVWFVSVLICLIFIASAEGGLDVRGYLSHESFSVYIRSFPILGVIGCIPLAVLIYLKLGNRK